VIDGKRQRTYTQMVETTFGRRGEIAIAVVQLSNLVLTAIAYTITAAKTMQSLATSACAQSGNTTGCFNSYTPMVLIFGAAQLLLSQVPTLEALDWASVVGAAASFGYGIIAFGLSAAAAPSPPLGSVWGQGGDAWQNLAAVRAAAAGIRSGCSAVLSAPHDILLHALVSSAPINSDYPPALRPPPRRPRRSATSSSRTPFPL
jgi:hypothetical protein